MVNNDHKRGLMLRLKVLEAELRLRERHKNAAMKGYARTVKMIEQVKERLKNDGKTCS